MQIEEHQWRDLVSRWHLGQFYKLFGSHWKEIKPYQCMEMKSDKLWLGMIKILLFAKCQNNVRFIYFLVVFLFLDSEILISVVNIAFKTVGL